MICPVAAEFRFPPQLALPQLGLLPPQLGLQHVLVRSYSWIGHRLQSTPLSAVHVEPRGEDAWDFARKNGSVNTTSHLGDDVPPVNSLLTHQTRLIIGAWYGFSPPWDFHGD